MFQFPGFALLTLCIQVKVPGSANYELPSGNHNQLSGGLPHSEIHGSKLILSSPWLIAEYHVLHRLLLPRHPPNALFALDLIQKEQNRREAFCFPPAVATRITASRAFRSEVIHFPSRAIRHETLVSVLDLEQNCLRARSPGHPHTGTGSSDVSLSSRCKTVMPLGTNSASVRTAKRVTRALRSERHWISGQGPDQGMVGRDGLEPSTLRLSGVRSNHLSYRPLPCGGSRCQAPGQLPRACALGIVRTADDGGAYRDRTDDPLLAKQMLSQLS